MQYEGVLPFTQKDFKRSMQPYYGQIRYVAGIIHKVVYFAYFSFIL